jgi:hypothetical protein
VFGSIGGQSWFGKTGRVGSVDFPRNGDPTAASAKKHATR